MVFVGTLYPLFVEAVSGEKLSVGAPYFNAVAGPLALLLAVLVGIGPLLAWRRERRPVFKQLPVPALLGVTALAITIILWPAMHILPRLGFMVAAYLAGCEHPSADRPQSLARAARDLGDGRRAFRDCRRAARHGRQRRLHERAARDRQDREKSLSVGPWLVQLQDVTPTAGKNWTAVEAELRAARGDDVVTLEPQTRYFSDPPTETNESAIRTFWNGQLYTVVGKQDASGAWQLRLWWKPFVTLIWAGGALIALGGALALLGRMWRLVWRRRPDADWRRERYA